MKPWPRELPYPFGGMAEVPAALNWLKLEEEPMFIIRQYNGFNTRQGFNEALRLALDLRALGWACCIENQKGEVIAE